MSETAEAKPTTDLVGEGEDEQDVAAIDGIRADWAEVGRGFTSLFSSIKSLSSTATNNMQRDLTEFVHVTRDNMLKYGNTGDEAKEVDGDEKTTRRERFGGLFLSDPVGSESWQAFRGDFDATKREDEVSALLIANDRLRFAYTDLVPSKVTHNDFWCRFFFDEKVRNERANLVEQAIKRGGSTDGDELRWSSDEQEEEEEEKHDETAASGSIAEKEKQPLEDTSLSNSGDSYVHVTSSGGGDDATDWDDWS